MLLTHLLGTRSRILRYVELVIMSLLFLVALTVIFGISLCSFGLCTNDHQPGSKDARRGAVSSLDARCSQIGIAILRRGGNAADAVPTPLT